MNGYLLWVALFLGNVALLVLWVHFIVKVLFGKCPHCNKQRTSALFEFHTSIGGALRDDGEQADPVQNH